MFSAVNKSLNLWRMVAALFLLNASARRVAVAWAPRVTTTLSTTVSARTALLQRSFRTASVATTTTTQRWMSTDPNEVVEKTEEEKAAIKVEREARK